MAQAARIAALTAAAVLTAAPLPAVLRARAVLHAYRAALAAAPHRIAAAAAAPPLLLAAALTAAPLRPAAAAVVHLHIAVADAGSLLKYKYS